MSRKDYGVIASLIRATRCVSLRRDDIGLARTHVNSHIDDLVEALIAYFSEGNPRFDANRFRKATGMIVD